MSFLSGLSGTPHLGDKGVGNYAPDRLNGSESVVIYPLAWDSEFETLTLSTFRPDLEIASQLGKGSLIHNLRLAITTNIYK